MSKVNWNDFKYIKIIDYEKDEIKNLPDGLTISTMCASAKLNSLINTVNIEKYLQLDQDDIVCVKLNNDNQRTLIQTKTKNKRLKKKEKKTFKLNLIDIKAEEKKRKKIFTFLIK